jgi:hypothetical protein
VYIGIGNDNDGMMVSVADVGSLGPAVVATRSNGGLIVEESLEAGSSVARKLPVSVTEVARRTGETSRGPTGPGWSNSCRAAGTRAIRWRALDPTAARAVLGKRVV